MRSCFQITRRLVAYSDGRVGLAEQGRITEHLASCASCRGRYERTSESMRLIRGLPRLDPDADVWNTIENGLATGRPEPVMPISSRRWTGLGSSWVLRPVAVAAAVIILVMGLLFASRHDLLPGARERQLNLAGYLDQIGTIVSADTRLTEFPPAPGFGTVSLPEAQEAINFPAVYPELLPGGYRLTAVRLYTCGDLRALQLKYRNDETGLCVFQAPPGLMLSFGERKSERCTSGGIQCSRTSAQNCSVYRFALGKTQCAVMTSQTDPAVVNDVIRAFSSEFGRINR